MFWLRFQSVKFLYIIVLVIAFAAGMALRDLLQDSKDKARVELIKEQVRTCEMYVVVDQEGRLECRPMMARFEIESPIKGREKWTAAARAYTYRR